MLPQDFPQPARPVIQPRGGLELLSTTRGSGCHIIRLSAQTATPTHPTTPSSSAPTATRKRKPILDIAESRDMYGTAQLAIRATRVDGVEKLCEHPAQVDRSSPCPKRNRSADNHCSGVACSYFAVCGSDSPDANRKRRSAAAILQSQIHRVRKCVPER